MNDADDWAFIFHREVVNLRNETIALSRVIRVFHEVRDAVEHRLE